MMPSLPDSLFNCSPQVNEAAETIYDLVDPAANLIFGAVVDPSLNQEVTYDLFCLNCVLMSIKAKAVMKKLVNESVFPLKMSGFLFGYALSQTTLTSTYNHDVLPLCSLHQCLDFAHKTTWVC